MTDSDEKSKDKNTQFYYNKDDMEVLSVKYWIGGGEPVEWVGKSFFLHRMGHKMKLKEAIIRLDTDSNGIQWNTME